MDDTQLQLSNQICFPLYSVSRLITKAYKPYLEQMEITYPQYLVLMVLWEKDGVCINEISEKLLLNTNTLSPLLKRMENSNLLKRNRSCEDERSVIIELTEKGENLKKQAAPVPDELIKILITENIQLDEVIQLKGMLNEWIELLSDNKKQ
ncbi:MAG: MarR family transcriptional regulator [Flavobacteriales bacterium]|jgi:DNA-binding MarR family transcriptional regulator|tara:strand:+ start:568 stop:1020 length:453 start_codon:yes stop_codon:yes gene_type:complete